MVENRRKSMKNWSKIDKKLSEIDAKMMIGSKMAFWRHLGRLGSHLGPLKVGWGIPSCEHRSESTPPGRYPLMSGANPRGSLWLGCNPGNPGFSPFVFQPFQDFLSFQDFHDFGLDFRLDLDRIFNDFGFDFWIGF